MKLLITCGGTGGHFYPGLAIALESKGQGIETVIALSGKNTEMFKLIAEEQGINACIVTCFSRPTKRWQQPLLLMRVLKDLFLSWRLLGKERPDAVLGMGSFASFGVCFAAVIHRFPLFLHEGNSVVGSSNRFLSKFARKLMLSFNAVNSDLVKCDYDLTGFPVRKVFIDASLENVNRQDICVKMGCDFNKKILLIFGGSQGAKTINSGVLNAIRDFVDKDQLQLLHIAGNSDEQERLQSAYEFAGVNAVVKDYVEDMNSCYHIADAAIARSGAASLFELALFKVPTLAIPLPWAADNHQQKNAEAVNIVAGKEIISICLQSKLDEGGINQFLQTMISDPKKLRQSGEQFSKILDGTKAASEVVVAIKEKLGVNL